MGVRETIMGVSPQGRRSGRQVVGGDHSGRRIYWSELGVSTGTIFLLGRGGKRARTQERKDVPHHVDGQVKALTRTGLRAVSVPFGQGLTAAGSDETPC